MRGPSTNLIHQSSNGNELIPIRQSVSALTFRLLEFVPNLAPMIILTKESFPWGSLNVSLYILGASHAIVIESNNFTITELLTCVPPTNRQQVVIERRADQQFECHIRRNDISIDTSVIPLSMDEMNEDIQLMHSMNMIERTYPNVGGSTEPLTRLAWRLDRDALDIHTLHTYPNEHVQVVSHSVFRMVETPI